MLFNALLFKDKETFDTYGGETVTLPAFEPKGTVHKATCDRFPLERYDPIIVMLYELLKPTYRGHAGSGPS